MRSMTTRFLLTCAAIGVAGGLLILPFNAVSIALAGAVPFASAAMGGVWLLPSPIAMAVTRRPGAALVTMLVAGLVNSTISGPAIIITTLMIGVAFELGFALLLYRHWGVWVHAATAVLFEALYTWSVWLFYNASTWTPWVQILFVALMLASGVVASILGALLGNRLRRIGVGTGLELGRVGVFGPRDGAGTTPAATKEASA